MLKSINQFLNQIKPDIIIQAPSRINLINPLDAVEADSWMPSVAINGLEKPLSVFLYLKNIEKNSRIVNYKIKKSNDNYEFVVETEEVLEKDIKKIKNKFNGEFKLIYASIYRFYKTNSHFLERFLAKDFEIGIITTIPRQSGLGGSAALIIAVLYGLAEFLELYGDYSNLKVKDLPINKDIIAEMATKVEDKDLNITAGYGDRYVISKGGLSFCSYFGKLFHKKISLEPLAVYDRIDLTYNIKSLPIIICFSGIAHDSGNVHECLRKLYLEKKPDIIKNYEKLAEIAWKSRFALMKQDWKQLGKYFKENTNILNEIMRNAGFEYGIGLANNILINLIENDPDFYAAKLTGAGGGGSVFALVNPEKIEIALKNWKNKLNEIINNIALFKSKFPTYPIEIREELKSADFFRIVIDVDGVKKYNL